MKFSDANNEMASRAGMNVCSVASNRAFKAAALIIAFAAIPTSSFAASKPPTWDINLGAGAVARPTFEGSDRYRASPLPFLQVTWNDMVSLGVEGLRAYWHHDDFKVGAGLTFDPGRDVKSSNIFRQGDARLNGLGKIDSALGLQGFASYQLGPVDLKLSATKFTGAQNSGVVVKFGADMPRKVTHSLMVVPHIQATWGNQNYMQTYFGVTAIQSSASSFPQFTAGAGLKDVSGGIRVVYNFAAHWYVAGDASVTQLMGDAAKSPISYSNTNAVLSTMIGYHF